MRILVVEDSKRLQLALGTGLKRQGHGVDVVGDGIEGLRYARNNDYDVVILDLMLPGLHGMDVLRQIRETRDDLPVLILTAQDAVPDRVEGLQAGADDYLCKPFAFDELVARLEALVRRRYGEVRSVMEIGVLVLDTSARTVDIDGRRIELSAREYRLLEYLALRRDQAVTRMEIEDHLYDEKSLPTSNAVDRLVCSVRSKMDADDNASWIKTVRGLGYRLENPTS